MREEFYDLKVKDFFVLYETVYQLIPYGCHFPFFFIGMKLSVTNKKNCVEVVSTSSDWNKHFIQNKFYHGSKYESYAILQCLLPSSPEDRWKGWRCLIHGHILQSG